MSYYVEFDATEDQLIELTLLALHSAGFKANPQDINVYPSGDPIRIDMWNMKEFHFWIWKNEDHYMMIQTSFDSKAWFRANFKSMLQFVISVPGIHVVHSCRKEEYWRGVFDRLGLKLTELEKGIL